jgi:hypothetical protein
LTELADRVHRGANRGSIRDRNGNTIGDFRLSDHTVMVGE